MNRMLYRLGVAVVILHVLVVIPHSVAHTLMHIDMNTWQNIYILLVILIAPIVAGILLWKRRRRGFALLAVSMAGSLLFGGYYHFIAAGPDNVNVVPPHSWSQTFQLTAVLLAAVELCGTIIGVSGISKPGEI